MSSSNNEILFKKFEIISCYKKNEHSAVYLANHIYLEKKVFLKVLNTETIPDSAIIERFKREAKILAQLQHPNIINVYDFGMFKEYFYISFEYFKSKNLREVLSKDKLDEETKKDIFIQILKGLDFAHYENVIHRDIKPENILVNDIFYVKITDFGLAQDSINNLITQQYSIVGTPAYMSPEQIQGENVTYKSDLFSLGITALELFTNKNPFLGKDSNETISNILSFDEGKNEKLFENLTEEIKEVIKRLLVADPENRIGSCSEALDLLDVKVSKPIPNGRSNKKVFVWSSIIMAALVSLYIIFTNLFNFEQKSYNIIANSTDSILVTTDKLEDINNKKVESKNENDSSDSTNLAIKPLNNKMSLTNENLTEDINKAKTITPISTFGELQVKCYPWAEVFLNDEFIETTPISKPIIKKSGVYQLTLVHPDYPKYSDSIKISEDRLTFFEVNLDTLFGYLYCQVFPWAEVYVNGEKKGITPLQFPIPLEEGKHKLTLKNPKHDSYSTEINIIKGDTLKLKFNMKELSLN
jgi:serine/threonine protein kinase